LKAGHDASALHGQADQRASQSRDGWFAHARVPALVGVICLMLLAGYWMKLFASYDNMREGVRQESYRLAAQSAQAVSLKIDSVVRKIDYATATLGHIWLNQPPPLFEEAVNFAFESFAPGSLAQVDVYTPSGESLFTRSAEQENDLHPLQAPEWASRPQLLNPDSVYICPPLQPSPTGPWLIRFSRPVMQNGNVTAIVSFLVSADYIASMLKAIFKNNSDVAVLLKSDGTYLARSAMNHETIGKSTVRRAHFLDHPGQETGSFEDAPMIDGIHRFYNWHRSSTFPLVVSVGMDTAQATRPVELAISESIWQNAVATILLVLLGTTVLTLWVQRSRKSAEVNEIRERLSKLIAEIPGAVFQYQLNLDRSSYFPYISRGVEKLYGIDASTYDGDAKTIFEKVHPDDRMSMVESVRESSRTLTAWVLEFRVIREDGQTRWVQARANPERLSDGATLWHGYLHDITHEHEVDEALKSREMQLDLALDAVQDGIWEFEHAAYVAHWDERIRTMLGYGPEYETVDARLIAKLVHPDDMERISKEVTRAQLADSASLMDISLRLMSNSGEWLWVQARGRVIEWGADNQPVRSMGLLHNISERVAETQLRDALLNRSVASITLVSRDRRLLDANNQFKSMFLKDNLHDLESFDFRELHVDDAHWNAFGEKYPIIREQNQTRFEFPMKDRSGKVHWFDMHGVLKEAGNPQSDVIWTWIDVSDRHAADLALTTERLRLRTLLQHFPGGVLIIDTDGLIVLMNEQAAQMLGVHISPDYITGLNQALLPDVIGQQAFSWLEQARTRDKEAQPTIFEVRTETNQYLEIEFLEIKDDGTRLGSVWLLWDMTDRKQEALKLIELAETDSMTGLPNRRCFMQTLDMLKEKHDVSTAQPGVLLMLDIDRFKKLNDSYGHTVGDQLLIHAAQLIRLCLREDDLPARLGGEEFAILLPRADLRIGQAVAERIRKHIEQTPFIMGEDNIPMTISIGLTHIDIQDLDQTVRRADRALYASKANGRNKTVVWTASLDR